MNYNRLISILIRHEGLKTKPYVDTTGKMTIGIGRNLTDNGITEGEAIVLLKNDIERCEKEVVRLIPRFWGLDSVRQEVIINMLFNLGLPSFSRFKLFIAAVNNGEYLEASKHMLDSVWAEQVGNRAKELAKAMEVGEFDEE